MQKNILIVDDHPFIAQGLADLLKNLPIQTQRIVCTSLEDAYHMIFESRPQKIFDIIILDWSMPAYLEKNICNGEDLAIQIRKTLPETKIIMMSGVWDQMLLKKVINNIKPEGIFEKLDLKLENFCGYVQQVLEGNTFKSPMIIEYLKTMHLNDMDFDDHDRTILTLLSMGYQTKDLELKVHLSLSTIKKRKQKMKEKLGMDGCSDIELIQMAKQKQVI